jgi:hypothetical protein
MRYRTFTGALTAAALLYSPVPSFAQTAPQPAVTHETGLQLADDGDDNNDRRRRRTMLAVLVFVTLVALYVLLHKGDEDEAPISP